MASVKPRVIVWGAGGHGKVAIDALLCGGSCDVVAVIDDGPVKIGARVLGVPIVEFSGDLAALDDRFEFDGIALAIGDNYVRHEKYRALQEGEWKAVSVIHPNAHVSRFAELGEGITILAGATICAGAVIEDNVCVNTGACIDHDVHLAMSCHVFPNATLCGGVQVEEFAYVGAGAVVKQNTVVHRCSFIGAGAVVIREVPEGTMVCGVPAVRIGSQTKRPNKRELSVGNEDEHSAVQPQFK